MNKEECLQKEIVKKKCREECKQEQMHKKKEHFQEEIVKQKWQCKQWKYAMKHYKQNKCHNVATKSCTIDHFIIKEAY